MKIRHLLLTAGLVASSVTATYFVTASTAQSGGQTPAAAVNNDYQLGATLYMQKAAEYRALCYQAFNWARKTIEADRLTRKKLAKTERRKPLAVVVDIDETMLDNSPAQAVGIIRRVGFNYPDWYAWGEMRKAKAIPGAVDFANFAKSQGVRIFYVSNRDQNQLQATIDNLVKVGFPDISAANVLLRQKDANGKNISTKTPRRDFVAKDYRIVALIGDNLNDLSDVYENKSVAERFAEVDKAREFYGGKFIVLPNAMYGDWESAIYRDDSSKSTPEEKRAKALELP